MATSLQGELNSMARTARSPRPGGPSDFLAVIPASERESLLARSSRQLVPRNEVVFLEGAEVRHLYVVLSGSFKLLRQSTEGKELIVDLLAKGDLFGAVVGPVETTSVARALEDSYLLAVPVSVVRGALAGNPDLAGTLLRSLEERRRRTEALATRLAFESVPRRLAALLLAITDARSGLLRFPLTQSEIAQSVGSSRETVCSLLNQFRRAGLLDITRGRIRVLDRARLETVG